MTDSEFAAACAAIESIATSNGLLLAHEYGTSGEDVREVVELAREHWPRRKKNTRRCG